MQRALEFINNKRHPQRLSTTTATAANVCTCRTSTYLDVSTGTMPAVMAGVGLGFNSRFEGSHVQANASGGKAYDKPNARGTAYKRSSSSVCNASAGLGTLSVSNSEHTHLSVNAVVADKNTAYSQISAKLDSL